MTDGVTSGPTCEWGGAANPTDLGEEKGCSGSQSQTFGEKVRGQGPSPEESTEQRQSAPLTFVRLCTQSTDVLQSDCNVLHTG